MNVTKLSESGYEEAMLGISLSWASNPERAKEIAPGLSQKQGGHNKFTESIMVWLEDRQCLWTWERMLEKTEVIWEAKRNG